MLDHIDNHQSAEYENLLLVAIQNNRYQTCQLLLERYAPCDRTDPDRGNIALHTASLYCEKEPRIISLLLEHIINPCATNLAGETAIQSVINHNADISMSWRSQLSDFESRPKKSIMELISNKTIEPCRQELERVSSLLYANYYSVNDVSHIIDYLRHLHLHIFKLELSHLERTFNQLGNVQTLEASKLAS